MGSWREPTTKVPGFEWVPVLEQDVENQNLAIVEMQEVWHKCKLIAGVFVAQLYKSAF